MTSHAVLGRARLSCVPCRTRKSKCDERMPCSSCSLRGCPDQCRLPISSSDKAGSRQRLHPPRKKHRASPSNGKGPVASLSSSTVLDITILNDRISQLQDEFELHLQSACCQIGDTTPDSSSSPYLEWIFVNELLDILPSRRDCEAIIEYLLQEADWLVSYLDHAWIQDIWSRFIHGGQISRPESLVIVAAITLGSCLLEEGRHIYYPMSTSLAPLLPILIDYIRLYLHQAESRTKSASIDKGNILSEILVLALTDDCLPFQGLRRRECWPATRPNLHQWQQVIDLLDENSSFWNQLNDVESNRLRKLSWHFVHYERWLSIYGAFTPNNPFCETHFPLQRPVYSLKSLVAPFGSISNTRSSRDLTWRRESKGVSRLFRVKEKEEAMQVPLLSELFMQLSFHCLQVAEYVAAIEDWRRITRGESSSRDNLREKLLHQASRICREIEEWKAHISTRCVEIFDLDASDYSQCRRASQALVIHVGTRQLVNIVTSAWVAEYPIVTQESSGMIAALQRKAFENAKEAVKSMDTVKKLLECGTIIQTPWVAMSIFDAVVTLAKPLIGASRDHGVTHDQHSSSTDYPHVVRIDRPLEISRIDMTPGESLQLSQGIMAGANKNRSMEKRMDLRQLASDIVHLLELLTLFKTSLLGSEAKKRLGKLIQVFSGWQKQEQQEEFVSITADSDSTAILASHDDSSEAENNLQNGQSIAILDSLLALDDEWWNQLLSWDYDEGQIAE